VFILEFKSVVEGLLGFLRGIWSFLRAVFCLEMYILFADLRVIGL